MSNLPNETAEGDELKVTGPDDRPDGATEVVDENDDVELSEDQGTDTEITEDGE